MRATHPRASSAAAVLQLPGVQPLGHQSLYIAVDCRHVSLCSCAVGMRWSANSLLSGLLLSCGSGGGASAGAASAIYLPALFAGPRALKSLFTCDSDRRRPSDAPTNL